MRRTSGYTMIELVIFIIVIGIIATTILASFNVSLEKTPVITRVAKAIDIAQQRMDVILGQKQVAGFNSFADPCSVPSALPFCDADVAYTVTSNISLGFVNGNSVDYKVVRVDVGGPATISLTGLVTRYRRQ